MTLVLKKKRTSLMEIDSGISTIRKSPLVSDLAKMVNHHHVGDEDSMFDEYGGKEGYQREIEKAQMIHGREYSSALEQAIYLSWSTGSRHAVVAHYDCGILIYNVIPRRSKK